MAAILSTIDVEDIGAAAKVRDYKDALTELLEVQERMQRAAASGAVGAGLDALGSRVASVKASAQAFREIQERVTGVIPPVKQLTDASVQYLATLRAQVALQQESANTIAIWGGALGGLAGNLRANVQLTQQEAAALRELAQAASQGQGFTAEQATTLGALNAKVAQGLPLLEQDIRLLTTLSQQYAVANREVLGLGTATSTLLANQRQQQAALQGTVAGLSALNNELRTGVQVNGLQAAAFSELSETVQGLTQVADADRAALAALVGQIKEGAALTPVQTAELQRLTTALAATTQARQAELSAVQQLLQGEQEAVAVLRAEQLQTQGYAQALTILGNQLQAGVTLTERQTAAMRELAEASKTNVTFTAEQSAALQQYAQIAQTTGALNEQQITDLRALAQGYQLANREALGLGTATEQLIGAQQQENAQIQQNLRGLEALSIQLKEGTTVTALQAQALSELATRTQQGGILTAQQIARSKEFTGAIREGTVVTKQHVAQMGEFVQAYEQGIASSRKQADALGGLKLQALGLLVALTTVAAGTTAFVTKSVELAARVETLGIVMSTTAKNAHLSNQEMLLQVEAIKRLGITTQEATSAVLQFVQADLKLSDAAKLARVAQDLAVTAGINSSQAFQRLLAAINTQQPELLRTFGIVTGVQQAMQKYAQEVGKTVRQLDPLDRKQAILNLVLAEGAKVTGNYEASMTTAAKQVGSMARLTEELSLKTGQQLLPIYTVLVSVVFKTLEALNGMSQGFFAVVAGVTATVAALVSFKLAIVSGLLPSLADLTVALFTTPWGITALAIGAVVTAIVALTKQTSLHIDELAKQAAAEQSLVKDLQKRRVAIVELQEKERQGKASVQEVEASYVSLAKIAPDAVDQINGKWQVNLTLLDEEIAKHQELGRSMYEAAKAQLASLELQKQAADKNFADQKRRLEDLKAQRAEAEKSQGGVFGTTPGADSVQALASLNKSIDAMTLKAGEAAAKQAELTGKITQQKRVVDTLGETYDRTQAQVGTYTRAQEALNEANAKFGAERVTKGLAAIGLALSEINQNTLPEFLTKFLEILGDVSKKLDEEDRKRQASQQKYQQAYENALETLRGESTHTVATLTAANKAFGEVAKGSDEYRARLERGTAAIAQYNKLSEDQQKKYKALGEAARELERIELEKLFDQWSQSAVKSANEISQAFEKTFMDLQQGFRTAARQQDNELLSAREQLNDKIYDMDRDNYERLVVSRMRAVDQEIFAENKRVDDIIRGVQRERTARDRALAEEEARQKERFDLIRLEMLLRSQAAMQQMSLEEQTLAVTLDAQVREGKIRQEFADEQIRQHADIRRAAVLQIQKDDQERLEAINREEAKNRELLEAKHRFNRESDEIEDAAIRRTIEASKQVIAQIRDRYDEVKNFIGTVFGAALESAASTFARMITLTEGWRDGMKSILNSVKQAFFSFVDSLVQKWIQQGIAGLLGRGPVGQAAGFTGLLQGLGIKGGSSAFGQATGFGSLLSNLGITKTVFTPGGIPTTQLTGLGTGLVAGGAGFAAGTLAGHFTNSRTAGALAGAGAGAGTGALIGTFVFPGIGTAIGAGIGAIAGALGGLISGGKEAREVKKFRDELIATHGGIERLKKEAADAGLNIDKMLSTKKMKDFQVEAAKLDLVLKFGSLDELRKRAQLVGVDIDAMFRIKKAEDFKKAVDALNDSLADQQKRIEALQKAGAGLGVRSEAFVEGIQKDLESIYASMGPKARTALEQAFQAAVKNGFSGDRVQFLIDQLQKVADGAPNILGLPASSIAEFRKLLVGAQDDFTRLGQYATATFAAVLKETGDLNAALEAVGPTLDTLIKAQQQMGFTADASLQKLLDLREVLTVNSDVAKSLSGISQILKGLSDAGALTKELFQTLGQDATAQFDKLISRGVDVDDALLALQPTLQQLYEGQKKYGYAVDEATQKLIDQAKQQGIVGDQFQSTNEKILDVLLLIAKTLGATIPAALDNFSDAAQTAAQSAYDDFNTVAYGNSPGGVRGIVDQLLLAKQAVSGFRQQATTDAGAVAAAADTLAGKLKDVTLPVEQSRATFQDVLPTDEIARFSDTLRQVHEDFRQFGQDGAVAMSDVQQQTAEATDTVTAMDPALQHLIVLQGQLGGATHGVVETFFGLKASIQKGGDTLSKSLIDATNQLTVLNKLGLSSQDVFTKVATMTGDEFARLQAGGADAATALAALQGPLQQLFDSQQRYGLAVDASTQALLDQARQQGLVGDQTADASTKMQTAVGLISRLFNGDLPDALAKFRGSVTDASQQATTQLATVPDGVQDIVTQLAAAQDAMAAFRNQVSTDTPVIDQNTLDLAQKFSAIVPDVQATLTAPPDVTVPVVAPDGTTQFVVPRQPKGDETPTVGVQVLLTVENNWTIDASALDGESMDRVMREEIEPRLADDAATNAGQLARALEDALAKYRIRT